MLRGKTIECISLIGLAVGREKFMPDAQVRAPLVASSFYCADAVNEENLLLGDHATAAAYTGRHRFLGGR